MHRFALHNGVIHEDGERLLSSGQVKCSLSQGVHECVMGQQCFLVSSSPSVTDWGLTEAGGGVISLPMTRLDRVAVA
jgi:hypothetical protein